MALIGCVGSRAHEALLSACEEAIREDSVSRLETILFEAPQLTGEDLNRKCLLHQASWLGYTGCVRLLISYGANPDAPHRKNGCTPLHLAHFCTIEDTSPVQTIQALTDAGANVNNAGSHKCGKCAIDHAIQHQRLDAVQALIDAGSNASLQSVLIAIDVANPQIIELLLLAGGDCGERLDSTRFWSQALHRVIYTPLKCPKECYKSMFKLLTQATVANPIAKEEEPVELEPEEGGAVGGTPTKKKRTQTYKLMIENELKVMAKDYIELSQYLYAMLIRNGFFPTESIKGFMGGLGDIPWVEDYLTSPPTLRDLTIRVVRACMYQSGNIVYGISKLDLPTRVKDMILHVNPL